MELWELNEEIRTTNNLLFALSHVVTEDFERTFGRLSDDVIWDAFHSVFDHLSRICEDLDQVDEEQRANKSGAA